MPKSSNLFWVILAACVAGFSSALAAQAPPPSGTDCNGNGVDDAIDIANGVLIDTNQDGVPDNCGLSVMRLLDFEGRSNSIVVPTLVVSSPVPVQALGFAIQLTPGEALFNHYGVPSEYLQAPIDFVEVVSTGTPAGDTYRNFSVLFDTQPPFSGALPAGLDVPVLSLPIIVGDLPDLLPRTVSISGSLLTSTGQFVVPQTPPSVFQPTTGPVIIRGDVDEDGSYNFADAIDTLGYLYVDTSVMNCPDAADLDDDGEVSLTDLIDLLAFLFLNGSQPQPVCGVDATPDTLDCNLGSICVQ